MRRTITVFASACVLLFVGGCRHSPEPPPWSDSAGAPTDESIEEPASPGRATEGMPEMEASYTPAMIGDVIEVDPDPVIAGEPVQFKAGPVTFRNGCEGIERSWARGPDEDGGIELLWEPKRVPPDVFCTMALHDQWIEASLDALEEGEYELIVPGVGRRAISVLPAD